MSVISSAKKHLYLAVARYFRFFANISLRRWHPRIIAITGSVGKTTMLSLLESQIGSCAHYNHDANSPYGVAFDILGLKAVTGSKLRWLVLFLAAPIRSIYYRHTEPFFIVEIDGERPRETTFLASWLRPEVTLWISLGRSHAIYHEPGVTSGRFTTIDEAIAHEFAELPRYTQKLVITDADNPLMQVSPATTKAKILPVSRSSITGYTVYPEKTTLQQGKTTLTFAAPLPPDIAIQLAMLTPLLTYLKLPLDPDFRSLRFPPGRSTYLRGKNGLKIIDSSYNAHLISMASILAMARSLRAPHKWLILGDIIEQGTFTAEEHTKLAHLIIESSPERVILVGRRTAQYTYPILKKSDIPAHSFTSVKQALSYLEKHTTGEQTLIFKGSQYLEYIIEHLLADPADAARLPRRDKAATRRRNNWGLSK